MKLVRDNLYVQLQDGFGNGVKLIGLTGNINTLDSMLSNLKKTLYHIYEAEQAKLEEDGIIEDKITIKYGQKLLGRYEDSLIKEEDLDLQSAATPCLLSHTIYGALGYRWDERKRPPFTSFGASYTFSSSNNAVIDRWTVWGKVGFSF